MLATGDARIKEKMDLDIQVTKLKMLKANHEAQQYEMQDKARDYYPKKIKEIELRIDCLAADLEVLEAHPVQGDSFSMNVMETVYTERKEAGKALIAACRMIDDPEKEIQLGEYRGFPMKLGFSDRRFIVTMKQHLSYSVELSDSAIGNIGRMDNALERIPLELKSCGEDLTQLRKELESAKEYSDRPFTQEEELAQKSARLSELNAELDRAERRGGLDKSQEEIPDDINQEGGPTSIIQSLKDYEAPILVQGSTRQNSEREVI